MSGTLLDLDCPRSWPVELLGYLNEHHDLFRGWVNGQGQVSAKAHDEAWRGLRRALQPYQILGWHYTRLTDAEVEVIRRKGMQLPDAEMLASRIDGLVKTSLITPDIARRLKSENRASEQSGGVYFCFFPPRNDDEGAIGRFFRHWGGEALYVYHEDDPITSPAISCVGTPCIVEADVPISLLRMEGNLVPSIYLRYLASCDATIKYDDYEDRIEHPLPAKSVRRVIAFPDPDFYSLTGCSEWRRPISQCRANTEGA